jgi:hypothetical protein
MREKNAVGVMGFGDMCCCAPPWDIWEQPLNSFVAVRYSWGEIGGSLRWPSNKASAGSNLISAYDQVSGINDSG